VPRAVTLRRTIPDSVLGEAGRLEPAAIRMFVRNSGLICAMSMSVHDLLYLPPLHSVGSVYRNRSNTDSRYSRGPCASCLRQPATGLLFERLAHAGRECNFVSVVVSAGLRRNVFRLSICYPQEKPRRTNLRVRTMRCVCCSGVDQLLGPFTARCFCIHFRFCNRRSFNAAGGERAQGLCDAADSTSAQRPLEDARCEWCERRVLQRILA